MARARNIKPGFFTNELLGTYDPIVCLTFAGLWCLADKEGRMEDRPLRIKAELFPYREGIDVNRYLTVLQRDGFIDRYVVDGVGYIQVRSFAKHQSPHHTERPKGYPSNPQESQGSQAECVLAPLSNGESTVPTRSDSLIHGFIDSLIPDSQTQKQSATPPAADAPDKAAIQKEHTPYQAIVDSYNATCGELYGHVTKITDKRKRAIKARWLEDPSNEDPDRRTNALEYWQRYYRKATRVEFFLKAARGENKGEHAGWRPSFDFLMRQDTWLGVREGRFQ